MVYTGITRYVWYAGYSRLWCYTGISGIPGGGVLSVRVGVFKYRLSVTNK